MWRVFGFWFVLQVELGIDVGVKVNSEANSKNSKCVGVTLCVCFYERAGVYVTEYMHVYIMRA